MNPDQLEPGSLEKYVDALPIPAQLRGFSDDGGVARLTIGMWEIEQQLHRDLPPTRLYAYGETQATATFPGPTIVARTGMPLVVEWQNHLPDHHFLPVDPTLHVASPVGPGVPTSVHVHGGQQEPGSDGHPDGWFTRDFGETGSAWVGRVARYHNNAGYEPLWYHDHALGITRLNVMAGLAGFYRLRDPAVEDPLNLPSGSYDLELVLQDRSFNRDGSLAYPDQGVNPNVHPVWTPESFGAINLVNGAVWPFLEVEPRKYRFVLLDGANARFYDLSFSDGRPFTIIGSDGGLYGEAVTSGSLLIGPGERVEVVVDFSDLSPGNVVELVNSANAPYPSGDPVDEHTSRLMQFRAVDLQGEDTSHIPEAPITTIPELGLPTRTRPLVLVEVEDETTEEPLGVYLNGMRFHGEATEVGTLGETELWEIVNITDDAHPIHLHLVDFQVVDRQPFDADGYEEELERLNAPFPTEQGVVTPELAQYLRPLPTPPGPAELGWKDTVRADPGQVTRVLVRWGPEHGGEYAFDATAEPGYVWHCHILEHEDNEMMRPLRFVE